MNGSTSGEFAAFLNAYEWTSPWRAEREESGMNNTTRMIYAGDERYVLRVYDNHRDEAIVRVEHAVLLALSEKEMGLRVPEPVLNREGSTVTKGPDGKLAALYHYIEGCRPSPDHPAHIRGLGEAAGKLSSRLAAEQIDAKPLYDAYYRFEVTHQAMAGDRLAELAGSQGLREEEGERIDAMIRLRDELRAAATRAARLPHQWIHGDIVFTNSVAAGDRIVGLLDFEFATIDVRAMELAVVLAEFPGPDTEVALHRIRLFCEGFGTAVRLNAEEADMLPELMQLRMMDVFLHFAGRLADGADDLDVWRGQIRRTSFVCEWIDRNRGELNRILHETLT
ncbi:phosphotransferase [Paenibacillus methanolicus]|uniref:Homoserine kinase type II n=1 Tax=Paenibacillus methanolicus TaxID=582686 RepID=A0A5S5C1M7_9BACL|nr:phosphotransferase [Paenibacillus methanolicus]TYP72508.1 homoserine kinase type II [Paenibacillus methanolicus]